MTRYVGFRIFIGPAFAPASSSMFYNWSVHGGGVADNLSIQTTLSATLADGATSMTVASAAGLATKGGLWVGPNGPDEAWEYVGYTGVNGNTISGLWREGPGREHNGVHTSGAIVKPFWELTHNNGRLSVAWRLNESLTAVDWTAEIAGIAAPQVVFRQYHLAIIQKRESPTGTWTNWLVGFLDGSTIRDDHRRVGSWRARIVSLAGLLRKIQVGGVRVGNFDAAAHATASSSPPLAMAFKERNSGDYVAADPSFEPSNVLGDTDGLWIAERFVGDTETPTETHKGFSQIFINPPSSVNKGYRWLEIVNLNTATLTLVVWDPVANQEYQVDIPSVDVGSNGVGRLIIAENIDKFNESNPVSQADEVYGLNTSDFPGASTWFDHCRPSGGALALKNSSNGNYEHQVRWGTQNAAPPGWGDGGWVGPQLAAPKPGETMRFNYLSAGGANSADFWEVGNTQSPGYTINHDGDDTWLHIELPGLQLSIRDDITDTTPGAGATLYLVDATGQPSTDGLPASGTLQIGDERISYSAKVTGGVTVSARGAGGTTAASHSAGDAVLLVVSQGGRTLVTDALPYTKLSWERDRSPYPTHFVWRWSGLSAVTPDTTRHENDYELSAAITNHATLSHTQELAAGTRVKSVLLEIQRMSANPGRPRINRIRAMVDRTYFSATRWLAGGTTVESLIRQIAINAEIDGSLITANAGGLTPEGFTTAVEMAWAVMESAAEMGGSYLEATADGRIIVTPDTFWITGLGGLSASRTWNRTNAISVEYVKHPGFNVSQVRIQWETPDGSTKGEALYPAEKFVVGAVMEVGPRFYASQAAANAAAKRLFLAHRLPHEWVVEVADPSLTERPRQIHRVQWQLDDQMQQVDRLFMVRQVELVIERTVPSMVLMGPQVDREIDG